MTRREQRETIFKILFKCEFNSLEEMDEQIDFSLYLEVEDDDEKKPQLSEEAASYITEKTKRIVSLLATIDEQIAACSDGWKFERIGKAELAILRLAVYEMKYDEDVPSKVAINEAVELTKIYCNEDARAFVNGILGNIERSM